MDTHLQPILGIPSFEKTGTFSPKNKYMWDTWFIKDQETWHMYYLQSDICDDPEERHHTSSIGHAISTDLKNWQELGTTLNPSIDNTDWDDLALWTGCVIKHYDGWHMYYTGRTNDDFWGQKIGLAFSTDLHNWTKLDVNPILEPEHPYCDSKSPSNFGNIPAFRDPSVWYDTENHEYRMLFSARIDGAVNTYNGAIGMATSSNSLEWNIQPKPILAPGRYNEMETSQLLVHKDLHYLFFSTWAASYEPEWKKTVGAHSGLHCYCGDSLETITEPVNTNGVVMDNGKELYVVKILEQIGNTDQFIALGWLNYGENNQFIGKICAPFIISIKSKNITFERFL